MKWLIRLHWCMWICLACIMFMGCAAVKSSISAVDACKADVRCVEIMERNGRVAAAATNAAGGDGLLASGVASVVSFITGVILGRKKK